jgi:hypothetical protein
MFDVETLVPLGLFMALAFIIVGVAKIVSDGRTRRRLIDADVSPELAKAINVASRDDPGLYGALKWGLVTGAIGLALITHMRNTLLIAVAPAFCNRLTKAPPGVAAA